MTHLSHCHSTDPLSLLNVFITVGGIIFQTVHFAPESDKLKQTNAARFIFHLPGYFPICGVKQRMCFRIVAEIEMVTSLSSNHDTCPGFEFDT